MCILFLYVAEIPTPDSYKVILAMNRDEQYSRPTKRAGYWGTEPDIVGGRDMEPGREGGSWLGMNKTGRIAALLNVLQSKQDYQLARQRRGRGCLVNNLLLNPTVSPIDYMNEIQKCSAEFNPFTLLSIDSLHEPSPQICYYSCSSNNEPQELAPGVYGLGNSFINSPFLKVKAGKEQFERLVKTHNRVSSKGKLIDGILRILKDQQQFHPDPHMKLLAADQPEVMLQTLSSRFIETKAYGTRTHTIILVDYENQVSFQEVTLKDPANDRETWDVSNFAFTAKEFHHEEER